MVCWDGGPDLCDDESFCGGFHYGIWCTGIHKKYRYVRPNLMCDGHTMCRNSEDEVNCNATEDTTTCLNVHNNITVPLTNSTRCSARFYALKFDIYIGTVSFCEDYIDQTNCSDPQRVGIVCPVKGYMTSVSSQILCLSGARFYNGTAPSIPQLCDDGLDKACVQLSFSCFIHKHFMCNGHEDCQDGSDETHEQCQLMTDVQFSLRQDSFLSQR